LELLAPISIAPEPVLTIGSFVITNSMFTTVIVTLLLIVVLVPTARRFTLIPKGFTNFIEFMLEFLWNTATAVVGEKKAKHFFPLAATIFLFVLTSNYISLIPGVGPIYVLGEHHGNTTEHATEKVALAAQVQDVITHDLEPMPILPENEHEETLLEETDVIHPVTTEVEEHGIEEQHASEPEYIKIPIFRSPSADLNVTLAIAIIAMFFVQFWGIKYLKLSYFKKFIAFSIPGILNHFLGIIKMIIKILTLLFTFKIFSKKDLNGKSIMKVFSTVINFNAIINAFVGILEIISEFAKIISFTFRLFGNIFAGEVLLIVITSITAIAFGLGSLPFYGLELFVGFIQALVFSMLTLVFLGGATESHDH